MIWKLPYIFTIFLSAFLLFQVQPIIAKILLPWFGGAAAVWITCMLFFQIVLLLGYTYAHWLVNRLKQRAQRLIHISVLALSVFVLHITPNRHLLAAGGDYPFQHLLYILLVSLGMPYFLLATTSPLLQSWYAGAYRNAMPYRLFALSNLASLLGLLAYPFLVAPKLTLSQQSNYWSGAYIAFAVGCVLTALYSSSAERAGALENEGMAGAAADEVALPQRADKIMWLSLAACASVLLLAVTNYLTQDIASVPFLWILPLSLYLLTFALCFDRSRLYRRDWYMWIIVVFLGGMSYALLRWEATYSAAIEITFFSAGLFACCMFCHGELATRKPAPKYLTSFYMMISLGGALGGGLVGIVFPKVLSGPFGLPIALNICALMLFLVNFRRKLIGAFVCAALVLSVAVASGYYIHSLTGNSLFLARNFYSCLKVEEYGKGTRDSCRFLVNGAVIHGAQFQDLKRRRDPISYYSPGSGIGLAIKNLQNGSRRVGVIGLGTGTLLAYARPGDYYHYYEINTLVKSVALRQFSYISDCLGKVDISIGDGRLLLEREKDQQYDLLAVDAFSGDSIPVHLLTVEAVRLYFRHLKPDGILALNITNLHLDLAPVVERICSTLGKNAVLISNVGQSDKGIFSSDWVLMTTFRDLTTIPEIGEVAKELESKPGLRVWTDDYSNLIQIIKF
ncbi:MAG: fused MFS/spermidine synthase [Syntrophobacteraceae bacterium]